MLSTPDCVPTSPDSVLDSLSHVLNTRYRLLDTPYRVLNTHCGVLDSGVLECIPGQTQSRPTARAARAPDKTRGGVVSRGCFFPVIVQLYTYYVCICTTVLAVGLYLGPYGGPRGRGGFSLHPTALPLKCIPGQTRSRQTAP